MITERDKKALDFMEVFRMATIRQIAQVAYDDDVIIANRRFKKFYDDKLLTRCRNTIDMGYIYSLDKIKSMKQYRHYMMRNETYLKFLAYTKVHDVMVEKATGSVRADMVILGTHRGKAYLYMVECETIQNGTVIDYSKYNNFMINEWKEYFSIEPTVLYVTDKKIFKEKIDYNYKLIGSKLRDFDKLIE